MADLITGGQRIDIAHHLIRFAHIGADQADQRVVQAALVDQLEGGDIKALFVNRIAIRPKAAPTDVDDMGGAGEKADQLALVK